jgi:hypothetical protein
VILHADTVTEDRTPTERTGGVDREHTDLGAGGSDATDECIRERRLPCARRTGDADRVRPPGESEQRRDRGNAFRPTLLDERDQLRDRAAVVLEGARDERRRVTSGARAQGATDYSTDASSGRGDDVSPRRLR